MQVKLLVTNYVCGLEKSGCNKMSRYETLLLTLVSFELFVYSKETSVFR